MGWILISLFFLWLLYREFTHPKLAQVGFNSFDIGYMAAMLLLAVLFAWRPYHYWRLEQFLSNAARNVSENSAANVHCNTVFDSIFDNAVMAIGHADIESGDIVFQHPWCGYLLDYLDDPKHASDDEIMSLHVLTHETMHVRGERDESKTDCQAIQRDYQMGKLLGIPDDLAKTNALYFYENLYIRHPYHNNKCAPGKAMDENLSDSTWNSY